MKTYWAIVKSKRATKHGIFVALELNAAPPVDEQPSGVTIISGGAPWDANGKGLCGLGFGVRNEADWPIGCRVKITIAPEPDLTV